MQGASRPKKFDRNLIVIGGGSAGLVTAYIAAAVKAKVTLIEKHEMGGDCLNTGCVPSKAILRSAKLLDHVRRAREFGLRAAAAEFDFSEVMQRVQRVIKAIEPHDSVERYTELGVECLKGHATLVDPWTVEVNGRKLTAPNIVIAAGAEPFVPPIPGLKETGYLTSDTVWGIREQPKRLVVLGGGPIGSELTQAFARLGSQVTQVEMLPRILPREDVEISQMVLERFKAEGIDVRVNTKAKAVKFVDNEKRLLVEKDGVESEIPFDQILVAVGRAARLKGYGLEAVGVEAGKTIKVNEFLQTTVPNIYACGDVAGPYQFTHTAAHMAWYCAVNALFGKLLWLHPGLWLKGGKFPVDYSVVPWATFTEPEVARVGLNELGEGKEHPVRGHDLRSRRPRPRDRRRGSPRRGQGAHGARQGQDPRRDHRRRARRRHHRRVRPRDAPRHRPQPDPRHDPHLPDAGRDEQVRRGQLEEGPQARGPARLGREAPRLGTRLSPPAH
jgi:pyruvate/2-oxoglutarate dehydrogenase complex dihydrolipoamide dehydrogenase (E3) component